jgi:hypothetical protein
LGGSPPASSGTGAPSTTAPITGARDPNGLCQVVQLNATPSTPDMMIVLDRSGSMGVFGRWQPSASAVRSIVTSLQSKVRFGLTMFPDPNASGGGGVTINGTTVQVDLGQCLFDPDPIGCAANAIADAGVVNPDSGGSGGASSNSACTPGKVIVPVATDNAAAIGDALNRTIPNGGTPTPETLQQLVKDFAAGPITPDAVQLARYVLLVTDGMPTCPAGNGSQTLEADISASNRAIEMLTAAGVRTYVIGYNTTGPGNEEMARVLDGFAQRGGTGDAQHRPVEDEASLLGELQRIAGNVVSCTFTLNEAPPRADYVLVKVDGKQVNLDDANGWRLVNGRSVELRGKTCDTFRSAGEHSVKAEVRCEVVPPLL